MAPIQSYMHTGISVHAWHRLGTYAFICPDACRIIVGRDYYEPYGVGPDVVVEAALSLLLGKKVPRQTEGMLQSSQFPINYFSISELEQWFGADFYSAFEGAAGRALDQNGDANGNGLNASFWRFNRVFDYGPINQESAESLSIIGAREDESK